MLDDFHSVQHSQKLNANWSKSLSIYVTKLRDSLHDYYDKMIWGLSCQMKFLVHFLLSVQRSAWKPNSHSFHQSLNLENAEIFKCSTKKLILIQEQPSWHLFEFNWSTDYTYVVSLIDSTTTKYRWHVGFNSRVITHGIIYFFSLSNLIKNSQGVQLKFQVHRDEVHALSCHKHFPVGIIWGARRIKNFFSASNAINHKTLKLKSKKFSKKSNKFPHIVTPTFNLSFPPHVFINSSTRVILHTLPMMCI